MSLCIYSAIICTVIYLIIFPLIYMGDAEKGPCSGQPYGCCPNTEWDTEKNICKDCPPGYFWINCSKACPYPFYGNKCNSSCPCNATDCDFRDGCREDSDKSTIESVIPEVLGNMSVFSVAEDTSRDRAVITTEDLLNTSLIIFSAIAAVLFVANIALIIVDKHWRRI